MATWHWAHHDGWWRADRGDVVLAVIETLNEEGHTFDAEVRVGGVWRYVKRFPDADTAFAEAERVGNETIDSARDAGRE